MHAPLNRLVGTTVLLAVQESLKRHGLHSWPMMAGDGNNDIVIMADLPDDDQPLGET